VSQTMGVNKRNQNDRRLEQPTTAMEKI